MKPRTPPVTTALLERRARALKRHLPEAVAGDYHGIHQTRVATRRLREAVPVLAVSLARGKAAKAQRRIRELTRALGSVRELDVSLALLDELTRTEQLPRAAIEDVRAHVIAARDKRRSRVLRRLEKLDRTKLDRQLARVASALADHPDEQWKKVLLSRLTNRARSLREAVDAAGQMYSAERLHVVRIAAKKLRYALELAAEAGVADALPAVRTIKRVQDVLGRMHDLQILQSHVATVQANGTGGQAAHPALEALAQHIEGECRHLHGRYLVSAEPLRKMPRLVRRSIAPLLAVPRQRRTSPRTASRKRTAR